MPSDRLLLAALSYLRTLGSQDGCRLSAWEMGTPLAIRSATWRATRKQPCERRLQVLVLQVLISPAGSDCPSRKSGKI